MSTCRCGLGLTECVICGLPETRLEQLASSAGVPAYRLRDYLRSEIEARRVNHEQKRSAADGGA